MLKRFALFSCVFTLLVASHATAADAQSKKILFFTKSSGFEHSVITWKNGRPSHAEKVLTELGTKNGWEFTFSR